MSAYFLSGEISQIISGVTSMAYVIGTGANEPEAIEWYRKWLTQGYVDGSGTISIDTIVAKPVLDQLLTETGGVPLDWAALIQSQTIPEGTTPDDFDAGFWLNSGALVPADNLPADPEAFRHSLSAENAADLNWSAEKNYLFIIKAFRETIDLVAIVKARNALMAAWSWRHHARDRAEARYSMVVEPCCQIVEICA